MEALENKIKIISETASISFEEARQALELADGDIEKALQYTRYVEKGYFTLQGKFVCGKTSKLYGVLYMLAHGSNGELLEFGLAVSYNEDDMEAPIHAAPEIFKKVLDELFRSNESSQIHSFLSGFYEQLGTAQIYQLYQFVKENRSEDVVTYFKGIMSKIFRSSERIDLEINSMLLSEVQCENNGLIAPQAKNANGEEDGSPLLSIYLETEPLISPGKGKTVDKFVAGELIPVRITDKRDAGKYLGKIMSNEFGIAFGQLKEYYYHQDTDRFRVTVEFGPKINGQFIIDPMVRLATAPDLLKDDTVPVAEALVKKRPVLDSTATVALLVAVIILLVIFIITTQ